MYKMQTLENEGVKYEWSLYTCCAPNKDTTKQYRDFLTASIHCTLYANWAFSDPIKRRHQKQIIWQEYTANSTGEMFQEHLMKRHETWELGGSIVWSPDIYRKGLGFNPGLACCILLLLKWYTYCQVITYLNILLPSRHWSLRLDSANEGDWRLFILFQTNVALAELEQGKTSSWNQKCLQERKNCFEQSTKRLVIESVWIFETFYFFIYTVFSLFNVIK